MTIWFECICGAVLSAPEKGAGRMGRCPFCQTRMRVPDKSNREAVGEDSDDSDTRIITLPEDEQNGGH
jgi:hypothetical protein